MKYLLVLFFCSMFIACQTTPKTPSKNTEVKSTASKIPAVDTSIFETFSITEGDTTYLMKKYFMVHLKKGSKRDQPKEEADKIQAAHMAHLTQLDQDKKICISGPFESDSDILGISIYSVPNLAIADSLANADPAVKAGRLSVEVFPFWAAVGSQLF